MTAAAFGSGARRAVLLPLALAALASPAVSACTGSGADDAARTAVSFEQLTSAAPAEACELLSGHTREALEKSAKKACVDALPEEDLPSASSVQAVQVYGHDAQVRLDGDIVFLARFADGWKVTAAGCQPGDQPDQPFDCDVAGG
jgi:hypothetical protein